VSDPSNDADLAVGSIPGSAGLCAGCVHARAIVTRRGSTFVLCQASLTDPLLERYPRLPVRSCHAFDQSLEDSNVAKLEPERPLPSPAEIDAAIQRWADVTETFRGRVGLAPEQALVLILDAARDRWGGRVDARTSMHDLLFTRIGDRYPFPLSVRVAWLDGVYEFELRPDAAGVIMGDRCLALNAPSVLEAFLYQLTGGSAIEGDAEPSKPR
jgi:hypothetical protein